MFPPPCQGGIASSTSALPNSTPMPVGANTLFRLYEQEGVRWNNGAWNRDKVNSLYAEMAAKKQKRLLITSTSEVYGKNEKDALDEDDDRVLGSARRSRWFYASAKAIDEAFALAYFQECLRIDPRLGSVVNNMGTIYAAKGRLDMALDSYQRAERLEPQSRLGSANTPVADASGSPGRHSTYTNSLLASMTRSQPGQSPPARNRSAARRSASPAGRPYSS